MSLVKTEHLETNKSALEIFVDADTFKDACNRVYLREVKKLNISGFRKGKAPKKVIEKLYGSNVFFDSAIDLVCPKAISDAVVESGLDVFKLEEIEPIEISESKGFSFKAIFILKPEAQIKNYKGIEVNCEVDVVDAKMVDSQIENLRQKNGRLVSVEGRAAKKGDSVLIDYEGFVDGKKFRGGSAKNFNLKLGSGNFIEGFEKQIVGHSVGDEFEINVVFPENYHVAELKGKPAKFSCKLNEIKELKLRKVDDEFAKDVSKFETLKELKEDIKKYLQNQVESRKNQQIESQILNFLAKNVDVKIPQSMLDEKTDSLAADFEKRLSSQGLTLEKYLALTKTSGYDLKDNFAAEAEFKIRTDLALEKIARLENIELKPSDYDSERKKIAEIYNVNYDEIKNLFSDEHLKPELLIQKTMNFLKDNAKVLETVKNVEPSGSNDKKNVDKKDKKSVDKKISKFDETGSSAKKSVEKKPAVKKTAAAKSVKTSSVKTKSVKVARKKSGTVSKTETKVRAKKTSTAKAKTKKEEGK